MQGEEEGINQAWNRFNELIEQGPRLGFSSDVLVHTFFFSLTPSCMQHVQMCAGGDLMEKTLMETAQLLQKICKAAAMRRYWEIRLAGESEHNSRMKTCAEISKEATLEVTKEDPIPEKLEDEYIKSITTPSVDFAESIETNKRSMSSTKPLREFERIDWVPIDYGEVFDKRRSFPNQKGMARVLEADFPPKKRAEDSYDLKTTGDDEVDPEHIRGEKNHGDQARSIAIRSPHRSLHDRIRRRGEDDTSLELRDQQSSMQCFMRHWSPSKCPIF
jgi:hypothetical protein